jgi:hypothetical protein
MRRLVPGLTLLLATLLPTPAGAWIFGPAPGDRLIAPPSQYFLPFEAGALDNHIDLQFMFTSFSLDYPGIATSTTYVYTLGVDAQISLFDRFQVGLNVPFLNHAAVAANTASAKDTEFGNMLLKLKFKLLGSSAGPFALSVFLDTLLPTGTGIPHDFAGLQGGGAISFGFSRITLNADLSIFDLFGSGGNGLTALILDVHAALRVLFLSPYLGVQLGTPLDGWDGHTPAVAISAGLQFYPISMLHLDLGTRIALDDNGRVFYASLGRATLVFGAGFRF